MAAEVSYFSTETADTAFLNNFVIAASAALESGEYEKANALYTDLGEAWYEGERALAALAGTEGAHEPPEGRRRQGPDQVAEPVPEVRPVKKDQRINGSFDP